MAARIGRFGTLPGTADTVVVGAGVAGLTASLHLARAGLRVVVIDKGVPWREGSSANAGTLALQNKRVPLLPFFKQAVVDWAELPELADGDIGYIRRGGLRVASTDEDVAELRSESRKQATLDVATEWLDGNELRARAPWLGHSVAAATFCADDGFASPLLTGRTLLRAVIRAGGTLVTPAVLTGQKAEGEGFRLETSVGPISTPKVVLATGPWSSDSARLFGIEVPVEAHINMLTVTERMGQFMDNLVVTHINGKLTLKQFPNGSVILGGGWRGYGDLHAGVKELSFFRLLHNLRLHATIVPHLRAAAILRSWGGFEAETPDGFALCGAFPQRPGLYAAVPAMAGWTGGPITGRLCAESVLHGREPKGLGPLSPGRFQQ